MRSINSLIKKILPRKLGHQLALYVSFLLTISMLGFSWHIINEQVESVTNNMKLQARVLANNISAVSAVHLLSQDYSSIEQLLIRAVEFPGVSKIQLCNASGKLLGDVTKIKGGEPEVKYGEPALVLPKKEEVLVVLKEDVMIAWHPIILGELIGWVKVSYNLFPLIETKKILLMSFY